MDDSQQPITSTQVAEIVNIADDSMTAAIIATGATLQDLEEAAAWAFGEDDTMGPTHHRLSGVVAQVYDILTANEPPEADRAANRG